MLHNSLERLKVLASYCFWAKEKWDPNLFEHVEVCKHDQGQCNLQLMEVLSQKGIRYDEVSLDRKTDFICEVYRLIRDNSRDKDEFLRKCP